MKSVLDNFFSNENFRIVDLYFATLNGINSNLKHIYRFRGVDVVKAG